MGMTDEELIAQLREAKITQDLRYTLEDTAADRVEQLIKERDLALRLLGAATQMQKETQAKLAKVVEALRQCLLMLDAIVLESGRSVEWDAEDSFHMGEWFEPKNMQDVEQARTFLAELEKENDR